MVLTLNFCRKNLLYSNKYLAQKLLWWDTGPFRVNFSKDIDSFFILVVSKIRFFLKICCLVIQNAWLNYYFIELYQTWPDNPHNAASLLHCDFCYVA